MNARSNERITLSTVGFVSLVMTTVTIAHVIPDTGNGGLVRPRPPTYELLGSSVFAEGCMGGGPHGCMCPMLMAAEFTGNFTLTLDHQTLPGHHASFVNLQDWIVRFDENDDPTPIAGGGYLDRWTEQDGSTWKRLTLDLFFDGEAVYFDSGIIEDTNPSYAFPTEPITLDNNATCYGYMIFLEAALVPRFSADLQVAEVQVERQLDG